MLHLLRKWMHWAKKLAIGVLAAILCAGTALPVGASGQQAAQPATLEEKINAIELEPNPELREKWGDTYMDRIAEVTKHATTNYEKLRAVYDDVIANHTKESNCVGYAVALECAFEALGFKAYHMDGECTTKDGGWTQHKWAAIVVDGKLVYFDANLPGRYGGDPDRYFAVLPKDAVFYRNAFLAELDLYPNASGWRMLEMSEIPADML